MSRPASRPVSRSVSRSEVDRMGKRGSYRLGALGPPGSGPAKPSRPFRPSFVRPEHPGTTVGWIIGAVVGIVTIAWGSALGLWFMPFVVGLATGLVMRWGGWRLRVSVPAVVIMAAAGWGVALWVPALRGLPVGATARTIVVTAGLPAITVLAFCVTLAVSVALGLAGLWLGRALTPRPARD